ncbi:SDR family oxidoreductase [Kibdelosporangium persicum]|uniref:Cholesterol dehydrogenase n=1 Tax=Kibdelosporangium persicum TaxID=2698649 RepID=A0ABX2F2N7_9PSEU|nr:SDR family oxidoreductase [Kibdelosporangium persicum]NRN65599.1 Cholesterol dehydrogenase [Kibdelosporangium persicum]
MILLTGGTGTLGRHVTPLLLEAGQKVRILSRNAQPAQDGVEYVTGDLLAGTGITEALDGVSTILHLAGSTKGDDIATRNLMAAAKDVQHVVFISVIGADRVPLAWLRSQLDAEQAIRDSGVPWTILRAAQFHDLVLKMVTAMAKLPVVPAPGMRLQPVDARDVAARLVELTLGQPAGLVPELAGPREYEMRELITGYLGAAGKRRPKLPVRIPGKAGKAYRAGDNLTLDGPRGTRTWEDFLAERVQGSSRH